MGKLKTLSNSMESIVEKYIVREGYILNDNDIFSIIEELKNLIEMNRELNYLEDIRKDIVNLKIEKDSKFNTIVKKDYVKNEELNEITVKFTTSDLGVHPTKLITKIVAPNKSTTLFFFIKTTYFFL